MKTMTSREFNQHLSQAQKAARLSPVVITNRGEPAYVLMSYAEYEKNLQVKPFRSALEALIPKDDEDIEFDLPPRHKTQRSLIDFED